MTFNGQSSCSTSSPSESKSARSAAVDDLLSLLDKDGTINRNRLIDIANQIDLENEQALDTESDEDNEGDDDDQDGEYDNEEPNDHGSSPAHLPTSPPAHSQTPPDPSLHPQHTELEGPNPSYTPDQVVDRLMKVLHTRTEIETGPLGIARNFLSKESPLFRPTFREIAQQLMDFSIIDLQASRTWEYLESTQDGNTATRQVQTTDRTCGPKRVFLFTLTRAGPEAPWLLHDIKFHSGAPIKILPNPYRPNNTS